jgi:orotate phosphoribosyltransferase
VCPSRANGGDWGGLFRQIGAVWEVGQSGAPHVQTSLGGSHVDKYFNSDIVVASPTLTTQVVESVLVPGFSQTARAPDWVLSYAPFGLFLAHAVAQALDARCAYSDPSSEYATHFDIRASESVLVIADDVHSGGSVLKTIEQVERRGARVLPMVFCLANLSGEASLGEREIVSAVTLEPRRYPAETCPLCAEGSPALTPRPNWPTLLASRLSGRGHLQGLEDPAGTPAARRQP